MKTYSIVLLVLLTAYFSSCRAQNKLLLSSITAAEFAEKIKTTPQAQILDVRTPKEYESQHLDNASNVDWNNPTFVTNVTKYDKSKQVYVYCLSGARSHQAALKLQELGFTSIYEMQGGILKWNAAGLSKKSDKTVGLSNQEYGNLLNSDKKVLISFYADWCAPCKKMTPFVLKMQNEMKEEVIIVRLNADENKTLLSEMKINELPTLLLYQNKEVKWKHSGFISENDLKKQL